jgi:hypothetical protein
MTDDLREIADFIANLPDDADTLEAVAERYPNLTQAEARRVAMILRTEAEEAFAEADALEMARRCRTAGR